MIDTLQSLDTSLLLFCNKTLSNPFFDWFFPLLTTQKNWYLPIALGALLSFWLVRKKIRHALVLLLVILTVGVSDLIGHTVKKFIARPRPFETVPGLHKLVDAYGFSFPSGHATNIFAACVLLALIYRRATVPLLLIACAVAFSRVYVGAHYPLDVLGGALLGSAFALLAYKITFGKHKRRES